MGDQSIKHQNVYYAPPLCDVIDDVVPKGLTDAEARELEHTLAAFEDQTFNLYKYSHSMPEVSSVRRKTLTRYPPPVACERSGELDFQWIHNFLGGVQFRHWFQYDYEAYKTALLIDVTKKEVIRAVDREGHDVLHGVIPLLTLWGAEDGDGGRKGRWAGDRLAIVWTEVFDDMERASGQHEWIEERIKRDSD